MLRLIIVVSLLAIVGAILGQWIIKDPGYILISFRDTSIETTLCVGIFVLICLFVIFRLIYLVVRTGVLLPKQMKLGLSKRKSRITQNQLRSSLLQLVSGNYASISEKTTSIFSDNTSIDMMIINAEAFLKDGRYDKLIEICQKIKGSGTPIAGVSRSQINKATDILMARAYKEQGKYNRALKLLQPFTNDAKNESFIFTMLKDIHIQDKRWQDLSELLIKCNAHHKNNLPALVDCFTNLSELDKISKLWGALDKKIKKDSKIATAYALALGRNGKENLAVEFLQQEIKSSYNELLMDSYKTIISSTPLQQLKFLEDFMQNHKMDKSLLSALAKLSEHNKLQAKARSYYEQLLANYPQASVEDKVSYAKLLEESNNSNDKDKAYAILRAAYPQDQ